MHELNSFVELKVTENEPFNRFNKAQIILNALKITSHPGSDITVPTMISW